MVAALTRSFGPAHLQLAEEVVQEALIQALRRWPFHGVPDNPTAWLYRVARNGALDRLRRDQRFNVKEDDIKRSLATAQASAGDFAQTRFNAEITDDQLRLIFLCCHPRLTRASRVALTLKTVMGLSVGEIAGAFLSRDTAVAQRITRAQRKIRYGDFPFEVPEPKDLEERLDGVLEVLYLAFNEGYSSHRGDQLLRRDLCLEALRLTLCLATSPLTERPSVHALAALMHFQICRFDARLDTQGELVLLPNQDRGRWHPRHLRAAFHHLGLAINGDHETVYHLQAAIAAQHASAGNAASTDWGTIADLYDRLLEVQPSPVVALNRAVAVARLHGPRAGLKLVEPLRDHPALAGYYLLGATRGQWLLELDRPEEAIQAFEEALQCPCSRPELRFLRRQLAEAEGRR